MVHLYTVWLLPRHRIDPTYTHEYEFRLKYLQSMDSIRLYAEHSSHCRMHIHHTADCCSPCLGNTSTLNHRFVFTCLVRICILFAFRCKPSNLNIVRNAGKLIRFNFYCSSLVSSSPRIASFCSH